MKNNILNTVAKYRFSAIAVTFIILASFTTAIAQTKVEDSKAVSTSAFVNGKFSLKPSTSAQKKSKTVSHKVYVNLDALVAGFEANSAQAYQNGNIKLVANNQGKLVAVQNGKELALRQFEFTYTGANPYWESLEENDPTNGIFIN